MPANAETKKPSKPLYAFGGAIAVIVLAAGLYALWYQSKAPKGDEDRKKADEIFARMTAANPDLEKACDEAANEMRAIPGARAVYHHEKKLIEFQPQYGPGVDYGCVPTDQ